MPNKSQFMHAAHRYARTYHRSDSNRWTYRQLLANGLQLAWADARKTDAERKQDQANRIREQIDGLKYKSLRYDTASMRRDLETQLRQLAA